MSTKDLLEQMEAAVFQPFFMEGIRAIHADEVAAGEFDNDIREYQDAMAALDADLTPEEMDLLAGYEAICENIRELSARHAFSAGIYAGFRHIFTEHREIDGGYSRYVSGEIMKLPKLQRHTELHQAVTKRNRVYKKLAAGRVHNCDSPMVCIDCYWGELTYSAAVDAFYCGYRAANILADRFGFLETDFEGRKIKLLTLEHTFRYIESFSEKERRLARG